MTLNLVFANTPYQLNTAIETLDYEGVKNAEIFVPELVFKKYETSGVTKHKITNISNLNEINSVRELIKFRKQIKSLSKLYKEYEIVFWLANDDHMFAQLFYFYSNIIEVRLFEDGLGSYIEPNFYLDNIRRLLFYGKLKRAVFLFPAYKPFKKFGANFKADFCYSYNEHCFPSQKNSVKKIIKRRCVKKKSSYINQYESVIVGQPLIQMGLLEKSKYQLAIKRLIDELSLDESLSDILYIAHHREDKIDYLPSNLRVKTSNGCFEDELFNLNKNVKVAGFFSTSLLNALSFSRVTNVICLRLKDSRIDQRIYRFLERSGCKII